MNSFNEQKPTNPTRLGGVLNTVEHGSQFSQPVAINCCDALHVLLQCHIGYVIQLKLSE